MILQNAQLPRARGARFLLHVVPALAYVAVVFCLGSIPLPELPKVALIGTDKLAHLLAFFGMAAVFLRAGRYGWPSLGEVRFRGASAAAASAVGGLLELYQMAVPGRSAELLDWAADIMGAVLAALVIRSRWVTAFASGERMA